MLRHREGAAPDLVRRFDREVTALCALPDGRLAAALDGREICVFAAAGGAPDDVVISGAGMTAVNALAVDASGGLLATDGSAVQPGRDGRTT